MKIADLFLEIITPSLPGNHDPEPMVFQLWLSSVLPDVTGFLNWSINSSLHICVVNKASTGKCRKQVNSAMKKIECTGEEITLFRVHGVNPASVFMRRENKPQMLGAYGDIIFLSDVMGEVELVRQTTSEGVWGVQCNTWKQLKHGAKQRSPAAGDTRMNLWSPAEKTPQRRKRKPTPGFLPGDPQRHRGLVGDSPWGRKSQTQFINWAHTRTQEWAAFTKEGDLMVFTKHSVCGVRPGAAALQLRPRKQRRGCWCNAGAELPKALHTSPSSDSFQSNGYWLVPTDGKKGASWVPNRRCNWTGQETRQNV